MVSIIIPVYNVEEYLKDCVNSVITQTYSDLQIILVDDGSTDSSGQICDCFAEKDKRIQVIHKQNGGLSDARNVGTAVASGEFVFYIDSDDYLEEDAIESLVEKQSEYGSQIVIGNYYYTYSDHEDCSKPLYAEVMCLKRGEAMEAIVTGKIQNFAWGKLIQTDIAKKFQFPNGKLFEDSYWAHLVLNDAEKIVVINKPIVHYRQRNNSISYTFSINRLDILEGWLTRKTFLEDNYPELVSAFMKNVANQYLEIAWLVLTRMKQQKRLAFQKLREYNKKMQLQCYVDGLQKNLICKLNCSAFLYSITVIFIRLKRKSKE